MHTSKTLGDPNFAEKNLVKNCQKEKIILKKF